MEVQHSVKILEGMSIPSQDSKRACPSGHGVNSTGLDMKAFIVNQKKRKFTSMI